VDKRRYDHALTVVERFDEAKIRLIEILNDQGYGDTDRQPQSVVWERMNLPIARGLRGLIYVLSDLSQVDPSDLSMLLAGGGRLRMGFAEIDPPEGQDPSDAQIDEAVRTCWQDSYYAFSKPAGTSLVCIQGHWSNVVDAGIKGGLATLATDGVPDSRYTPLYARAVHVPRPWGVTALFAEDTGAHAPLDIDWTSEMKSERQVPIHGRDAERAAASRPVTAARGAAARADSGHQAAAVSPPAPSVEKPAAQVASQPAYATFWDLARGVNRSDPAALALASNGVTGEIAIDANEIRKLLGTVWFRGVVPRLSQQWRERVLDVLADSMVIPDHVLKVDHRDMRLSELTFAQLNDVARRVAVPEAARADVELLLNVGRLLGGGALPRLRFAAAAQPGERSKLVGLLQGLRG
jgi:hypothetical protein